MPGPRIACLVVAAGRGTRARQADGVAKQYQHIGAVPVLTRTLRVLASHPRISDILVVFHPDDRLAYDAATQGLRARLLAPVPGGATRQDSVRLGLEALAAVAPDIVLVHDAARPFLRHDLVDRVLGGLEAHAGAIPALPVADTLKRNAAGMLVGATVARNGLYRAQTPQGFRFPEILAAHRAAAAEGRLDFTDDAAVAEWRGLRIAIVEGAEINRKLTTAADIAQADREFRDGSWDGQERRAGMARGALSLVPGDRIRILGAVLDWRHGDAGGGDRAAATIALALLRAAGLPDADMALSEAGRRVGEAGGGIASVDVTLLATDLRLDGQREAMRGWIAERLAIEPTRVGIEARAPWELGLEQRDGELALVAHAVVTVPEAPAAELAPASPAAARDAAPARFPDAIPAGPTILSRIRAPADLHALPERDLPRLADEMRAAASGAASPAGGDPGQRMDLCELMVALHRVFDPLRDRLVLGVGPQARAHAVLASRYAAATLPAADEAAPGEPHPASPVSTGLGRALARDLRGGGNHVVCVIDGAALSAGMAYEALNDAGMRRERLVVILADSDAQSAEPVGAVSAYLARLSSSSAYFRLRDAARQLARRLPRRWERRAARAEELTRTYWTGGTLFEELGFHHVGPIDGHDFAHLLPVLGNVRDADAGPILVHVVVRKDAAPAPGAPLARGASSVLRDCLAREIARDPDVVVVTAGAPAGADIAALGGDFPGRVVHAGLAVQHAIGIASGLAGEGLKPFLVMGPPFPSPGLAGILEAVATRAGATRLVFLPHDDPGVGGEVATPRPSVTVPDRGIAIMVPADPGEMHHMVATQVALDDGPSLLLVPRPGHSPAEAPPAGMRLEVGRGRVVREGRRVALLSLGRALDASMDAVGLLAAHGLACTLADARFAAPLDEDLVRHLAGAHEVLVVVEEEGSAGFAREVLQVLAAAGMLDGGFAKARTIRLDRRPEAGDERAARIAAMAMAALGGGTRALG